VTSPSSSPPDEAGAADTLDGRPRRRRVRGHGRLRTRHGGAPLPLLLPALLGLAFLVLPLVALLVRAPWRSMPDLLTSTEVWQALQLSLLCATAATVVSLVLGVPLAWLLARVDSYGPSSPSPSCCRRWSAVWRC
jgi:molybdate transport system permease protein